MLSFMRLHNIKIFLTLVVVSFWIVPFYSLAYQPNVIPPQSIDLKAAGKEPSEILYKFRSIYYKAFKIGLGYLSGKIHDENEQETTQYISLTQSLYAKNDSAWEPQILFLFNQQISASFGYKKVVAIGEYNEPYGKAAVLAHYLASESFGSVVSFKRYGIKLAVGFEDFLKLNRHFQLETSLDYTLIGLSYSAQIDFNIPF